jgi:hypothetical protein
MEELDVMRRLSRTRNAGCPAQDHLEGDALRSEGFPASVRRNHQGETSGRGPRGDENPHVGGVGFSAQSQAELDPNQAAMSTAARSELLSDI